jgi:hypothetical protein
LKISAQKVKQLNGAQLKLTMGLIGRTWQIGIRGQKSVGTNALARAGFCWIHARGQNRLSTIAGFGFGGLAGIGRQNSLAAQSGGSSGEWHLALTGSQTQAQTDQDCEKTLHFEAPWKIALSLY